VTGTFILADLSYTDKPTAYVSYFLETEGAEGRSGTQANQSMRDSARILGSVDGGLTWELLATNNSLKSGHDGRNSSELAPILTASSAISTAGYAWENDDGDNEFVSNQQVQELFDMEAPAWRQARIDLGMFAGESAVQLRFDFSTYGELSKVDNSNITPESRHVLTADIDNIPAGAVVSLDSVEYWPSE
jgi:hypothetical protein